MTTCDVKALYLKYNWKKKEKIYKVCFLGNHDALRCIDTRSNFIKAKQNPILIVVCVFIQCLIS